MYRFFLNCAGNARSGHGVLYRALYRKVVPFVSSLFGLSRVRWRGMGRKSQTLGASKRAEAAAAEPEAKVPHAVDEAAKKAALENVTLYQRLTSPRVIAAEFDQFIGAAVELASVAVRWRIIPFYSGVVVNWWDVQTRHEAWLREVEREISTFAACHGLMATFLRH